MASVQELLLAAQAKAKKSPLSSLADLITTGVQGYNEGSKVRELRSQADLRRAEIAKGLIESTLAQQKAEQERQSSEAVRSMIQEMLGTTQEQNIRDSVSNVGKKPAPVTPSDKFDVELSLDESGKGSIKLKSKAPKVNAPSGYRYAADGITLEPIPGGPADIKAQTEKAKAELDLAVQNEKAQTVLSSISDAKALVSDWSTKFGSLLKNVPGTDAKALEVALKNIKANLGVDQLQQMRQISKTGASGFGALSDRELDVITTSIANLDQAQRPEDLIAALDRVATHYNNWLKLQQGINPYKQGENAPAAGGTPPPPGETPEQRKQRLINELKGAR